MRVFISILIACTAGALCAQETDIARARLLEKEGDSIGARAILHRAASTGTEGQAAFAEFLDRHRDPAARAEYEAPEAGSG